MAYRPRPSAEELAGSGFEPADYDETAEIWPENWPAWHLFAELDTQWHRAGMEGRKTGLQYPVLWARMDRMNLTPTAWEQLYDDVRELEAAALRTMNTH